MTLIDEGVVSVYSKGSWKQFDVDHLFGSTQSLATVERVWPYLRILESILSNGWLTLYMQVSL